MPEDRRKRSETSEAGNLKFLMSCLSRSVSGGENIWAAQLHVFHHYVSGAVPPPLCDQAEQSALKITCNFALVVSLVARDTVLEAEVCRDQEAHEGGC